MIVFRVTPNEYLDRRRPEWLDAELCGLVRFDLNRATLEGSRLVEIRDPVILRAFGAA